MSGGVRDLVAQHTRQLLVAIGTRNQTRVYENLSARNRECVDRIFGYYEEFICERLRSERIDERIADLTNQCIDLVIVDQRQESPRLLEELVAHTAFLCDRHRIGGCPDAAQASYRQRQRDDAQDADRNRTRSSEGRSLVALSPPLRSHEHNK
jgi:hypothetical protein